VGGTSGSGKSTVAREISTRAGVPYTEIDALHHGPGWIVRAEFLANVEALSGLPHWVTEYQYAQARCCSPAAIWSCTCSCHGPW